MIDQTVPIGPGSLPATVKILAEQWGNYDYFRDRPIDPHFEIKYKVPEDRFSPYTLETAKFIGKQFGMSPRKIQHLISSSTGGLGTDVLRAGEKLIGISPETKDLPANIPGVGRLFARTDTAERRTRRLECVRKEEEQKIKHHSRAGKTQPANKRREQWNLTTNEKQLTLE